MLRGDSAFAAAYAVQDPARYELMVTGMQRSLFDRDTCPGAEPEDLLALDIPALIIPGHDASHATSAARYLEECLPRAQYWDVAVAQQAREATNTRLLGFLAAVATGLPPRQRGCGMIIDCHCHYTTEPAALHQFRDRQLAALADRSRKPPSSALNISDATLLDSVAPQLKMQAERGTTLTFLSPRAAGMAHHVGTEEVSRKWTTVSNDLIHRICSLLPGNFIGVGQLPQFPGAPVENCCAELEACCKRSRFRRCQSESRSIRRLLDGSAADRPVLVPHLRETVRAGRSGNDPRVFVLQSPTFTTPARTTSTPILQHSCSSSRGTCFTTFRRCGW